LIIQLINVKIRLKETLDGFFLLYFLSIQFDTVFVIEIIFEIALAKVCGYERDARTSGRIKFAISF
jgi:hypothetical protein